MEADLQLKLLPLHNSSNNNNDLPNVLSQPQHQIIIVNHSKTWE